MYAIVKETHAFSIEDGGKLNPLTVNTSRDVYADYFSHEDVREQFRKAKKLCAESCGVRDYGVFVFAKLTLVRVVCGVDCPVSYSEFGYSELSKYGLT